MKMIDGLFSHCSYIWTADVRLNDHICPRSHRLQTPVVMEN